MQSSAGWFLDFSWVTDQPEVIRHVDLCAHPGHWSRICDARDRAKVPYDSSANQTIMQFQGIYQTQRDVYQGAAPAFSTVPIGESTPEASNLLQEVQTCYNSGTTLCTGTAVATPISKQTVTTILPGTPNLESQVVSSYNSYGQLTEEDDYPCGSNAPGTTALRKKVISILTVGTTQAIQTAQIQDGSGAVKAQTTMTFDQGSVAATNGTPQHTNPTVGRGNPTTISYLVHGSTALTKTLAYFDTGNLQTLNDVNLAQTTYNYPDATSTCGNSFPTSVGEPLSLSQSMAWNCTGGIATSVTDENSKTVTTSYTDTKFWRPHSTTDQLSNATTLTYGGQTSVESSLIFNSNNSTSDTLETLDGLGRSHIVQTRQSPSSSAFDSVETDYDVIGRPYKVIGPYSAAAGSACSGTCPTTTTTYDASGRVKTLTDAGNGTVTYTYSRNDVLMTIRSLGRMVEQNRSGTYTEIAYAPTGEKLALMSGQTLQKAFVSLTGGATAVYTSSGLDHYRHPDWLGSARLGTTPTRTVSGDVAYAPYGEAYAQSGSTDLSFTGQNQDTVSNEYDFRVREYGIQGRWPSPDPAGIAAVNPANPQSWNRYAYVQNNPLSFTDPTGAFIDENPDGGAAGDCDIFNPLCGFGCDPEFGCWVPSVCFGCSGGVWVGGNSSTPQAPPAPPGGYGAGIDPYGTWDESLPAGVQVFPHIGFPGINLPSGSRCDLGVCDNFTAAEQAARARKRILDYLRWVLRQPWMVSWIFPVGPVPGLAGVGPAGSFVYNPQTHMLCGSVGLGASVGDTVSFGPFTRVHTNHGYKTDDIFSGGSLSGGANVPLIGLTGPGVHGTINQAGSAGGWDYGVAGVSAASTTGGCMNLP